MAGMKGKVSVDGLKKFQDNLNFMNEAQRSRWTQAAVKELAASLLRKVPHRTPSGKYPPASGKKGGTLRRHWTVGNVVKSGDSYTIDIINPTEYASYVEFGHRTANHSGWVEGKFMLTISEQELQRDAPKILMNRLNRFMKEVFG